MKKDAARIGNESWFPRDTIKLRKKRREIRATRRTKETFKICVVKDLTIEIIKII